MTEYARNFSLNLKTLRAGKGLTQRELAEILGYSEKTVSKWECSASVPDVEALFNIAALFRISIEALFSDRSLYFLGIDGGGTKTALALADGDGNVIRTLKADPCNPIDIGSDAAKRILKDAIYQICRDIPFSSVSCFAGIAGGATAGMQQELKEFFDKFGFYRALNDSDNKNIIAAGLGDEDGITVIMGTGVCVYTQKNKETSRISGWGYLIDNGGSGYNLGRDALSAYFCACDKTGPETLLMEEIDKLFPGGAQKIMGYIYKDSKKTIASFAPAVFTAKERGDKAAEAILRRNMAEVAHFIKTAAEAFGDRKIPVVLAGGLTNRQDVIEYIKNELTDCDNLDIKILKQPPVQGAVILARQLAEREDGDDA